MITATVLAVFFVPVFFVVVRSLFKGGKRERERKAGQAGGSDAAPKEIAHD
jgi:multidrug efflux pump